MDQINHWWRHGKPSNDVKAAGVIVRQFDALSKVSYWEPCPEDKWCGKYRFIWPSTIVNMKYNKVMYRAGGEAGLVLAPPPHNRFYCAYPGDGNSMGHFDENFGCQKPCVDGKTFDCSFDPERLTEALTANSYNFKHNEIVIDAQFMKQQLPASIIGVFYMDANNQERAATVHREYIKAFGLPAERFPLLHFSTATGFSKG